MKVFESLTWQSGCQKIVTTEFKQEASGNSVWQGMDYYNNKKVISWEKTDTECYDGIASAW